MNDFNENLASKYAPLLSEIKSYLQDVPGASDLRAGEDFDRDGVILFTPRGTTRSLRLFLSREFLEDLTPDDIIGRMKYYRVSDKLKGLQPHTTLFVTTDGTFVEATSASGA